MNFQSWGLDWFNKMRNAHMVEPLTIVGATFIRKLSGSVIEPETDLSREGIRIKTDKTLFIFNTKDLEGLKIQRGVLIKRGDLTYEVIIDNNQPHYYNDPNRIETVVPAKCC